MGDAIQTDPNNLEVPMSLIVQIGVVYDIFNDKGKINQNDKYYLEISSSSLSTQQVKNKLKKIKSKVSRKDSISSAQSTEFKGDTIYITENRFAKPI